MAKGKKRRVTRSNARLSLDPISERRCRCKLHDYDIFSETTSVGVRVHSTSAKDFQHGNLRWLIQKGYMTERNKIVCSLCLNYAAQKIHSQSTRKCPLSSSNKDHEEASCSGTKDDPSTPEVTKEEDDEFTLLIRTIESGQMSRDEKCKLANALGCSLSKEVYDDSKLLQPEYSDLETLHSIRCTDFLHGRPSPLVSFLLGIESLDVNNLNDEEPKLLPLCVAIEQIYKARNSKFIGPITFGNGVIKWTMTGSKTAYVLDGASTAGGSITTLRNFLNSSSGEPNTCFSGDVDVFSDNTQRVGKTVRVRESGTTPVGVATNVVFIQSQPPTDLQSRADLKPSEWPKRERPISESARGVTDVEEALNENYFRPYRIRYQADVLKTVLEEVGFEGDRMTDHVDLFGCLDPGNSVCVSCSEVFPNDLSSCPKCKHNRKNLPDRASLYGDVPNAHPDSNAVIKMGEIIGVNPNSRSSLKVVVDNLTEQCNIKEGGRQWVRLGFDGVPYRIVDNIISSCVTCNVCGEEIDTSKTPFALHVQLSHPGMTDIGHKYTYGHILLVPGAGHIEKNLLIVVFRLCRHIFLEFLVDCLGFKSKRAKDFVLGCSNHHVSWQILTISLEAFAHELLYQFVLDCHKHKKKVNINDFAKWREQEVKNPNYNLMFDVVFNVFLGMKCYRAGIRRNHSQYALAGRQKVAPLVYAGKHTIYQRLLWADMKNRVEAPPEVQEYMERNESFSRTGDPTRGEGGDYVTEAENRSLKSHLPPGIPTEDKWRVASRHHENLKQLRHSVFERANVQDPNLEATACFNFEGEVQMLRSKIRISEMLHNPRQLAKGPRSIDGKMLDSDLVNFYFTACDSYRAYKAGEDTFRIPICVTPEDRAACNDIGKKTNREIELAIIKLLERFPDQNVAAENLCLFQETLANCRGKKAEYISFYMDMEAELNRQLADATFSIDDVQDMEGNPCTVLESA